METWVFYIISIGLTTLCCLYFDFGKDGFEVMVLSNLLYFAIKNDLKNDNNNSKRNTDHANDQ